MSKITLLLTEGFADWETAFLAGVAQGFYGVEVAQTTLDGLPVTSAGGLCVHPKQALDAAIVGADALVLCGGTAWRTAPPDIGAQLANFDGVIAAICDATRALAASGLLNDLPHTANSREDFADLAGYQGAVHYSDAPSAIRSGRIVTAPGTAPVSFMAEVLAALGLADDNLRFYLGMLGAEHQALARAA